MRDPAKAVARVLSGCRARGFTRGCLSLLGIALTLLVLASCSSDGSDPQLVVVANGQDDSVSVLDSHSYQKVAPDIPLSGDTPTNVTISPDGRTAYVSCKGAQGEGISVVDLVSLEEVGFVALSGKYPSVTAIVGDFLYVGYEGMLNFDEFHNISVVDISRSPPVEVDIIGLENSKGIYAMLGDPEHERLFAATVDSGIVGGISRLYEIDLSENPPIYVAHESGVSGVSDIVPHDGLLYLFGGRTIGLDGYRAEIGRFDLATSQIIEPIPSGTIAWLSGGVVYGGKAYATVADGALAVYDLERGWDGYSGTSGDDTALTIELPFDFPFGGELYDTVQLSSNGFVTFGSDMDPEDRVDDGLYRINGFAPLSEDLYSTFIGGYQARVFEQRAVFQWFSPIWGNSRIPEAICRFELVIFADGKARFDYKDLPLDISRYYENFPYGVAAGGSTLIDLRSYYGSAMNLEGKSLMWDPAAPGTVAEVVFQWEDIGVNWIPLSGGSGDLVRVGGDLISSVGRYFSNEMRPSPVIGTFVDIISMDSLFVTTAEVGAFPTGIAISDFLPEKSEEVAK